MPTLSDAAPLLTTASSTSGSGSATAHPAASASASDAAFEYGTSKIVRTAIAAGVIVLALTALVLFFKISSWIRYHQHLRRQRYLALSLQSEQRANAYEIAAWSDEPGTAPIWSKERDKERERDRKRDRKERKAEMRQIKRGGANAWAVREWEGVAA
ncbi:hypothetical protein IAU60_004197 [Kwoniella sp. DSM 27419]